MNVCNVWKETWYAQKTGLYTLSITVLVNNDGRRSNTVATSTREVVG